MPELPRAPTKAASARALAAIFTLLVGMGLSTIERIVLAKFVPVSASATGKTFILFSKPWFSKMRWAPARKA